MNVSSFSVQAQLSPRKRTGGICGLAYEFRDKRLTADLFNYVFVYRP